MIFQYAILQVVQFINLEKIIIYEGNLMTVNECILLKGIKAWNSLSEDEKLAWIDKCQERLWRLEILYFNSYGDIKVNTISSKTGEIMQGVITPNIVRAIDVLGEEKLVKLANSAEKRERLLNIIEEN